MLNRILQGVVGAAALAAVASPLVMILLLDPRVGLRAHRIEPEPAPVVAPREACPPCRTAPPPEPEPARPAPPPAPPEPAPPALRPALSDGIATPDVAGERETQRALLLGATAHPDRVSGSAAWLDVVGLRYTAPRAAAGAPPLDPNGYRRVRVDLAQAPDRALVVLADQPLALSLAVSPPDRAGALGVESRAAFTVAEGRPGLLGGFRSTAFGAPSVAPLLDTLRPGPDGIRTFCAALRLWAGQYGLPVARLRYTLLENAAQVRLEGDRLLTDGSARGRVAGRRLAVLCRQ
ncbi:hypothetical protein [Methylobacterium oryzisoli]|uniref:hypothetical protein n=1 Tax=Methylobacterium oryzisoli TaxID=3385502 RepID=UPI003892AB99